MRRGDVRKRASRAGPAGLALSVLLWTGTAAAAPADQSLVLGLGGGGHTFSAQDDYRAGAVNGRPMNRASLGHVYAEWFGRDTLGFGLRYLLLVNREHATAGVGEPLPASPGGEPVDREVTVAATLVTLNWVVAGARRWARLALLGGVGQVTYTERLSYLPGSLGCGASIFGCDDVTLSSRSTGGQALLYGAYVDLGGPGLGMRLGGQVLETELPGLKGHRADGSGSALYADLRWAFD